MLIPVAALALAPQSHAEELYEKSEHHVRMRDGVELYTAVYVPREREGPLPVLLRRTPYSCRPYGPDAYPERIGPSDAAMEHGFIVVLQDVRGRWMSDGTWDNMRPHVPGDRAIDESSDTYDTIEWLLGHVDGHSGRVGMWGISYPGFYCVAALPEAHPALVAVVPQAPVADFYFDDFHKRGAFVLAYLTATPTWGVQKSGRWSERWYDRVPTRGEDAYAFFLELGPLRNVRALLGDENYFWGQLVAHPDYDDFWRARSILPHLGDVGTAVLVVGGWYDAEDLYGPLQIHRALERGNPGLDCSLVMGPWGHGDWARRVGQRQVIGDLDFGPGLAEFYAREIELPWLVHQLEDGPDPELPEALVYDTGRRDWRRFDAWPPRAAKSTTLHLRAGGRLDASAPAPSEEASTAFRSDPADPVPYREHAEFRFTPRPYMAEDQAFAAERDDVLVFMTEPLESDMTLAGDLTARLVVSTTGTAADWVVKLVDVHPPGEDGAAMHEMVRSEAIRGRYREGFDAPKPFVADEQTAVDLPLQGVLHTFRAGHRLAIHVQSTWFPLIDRNPQTYVPNVFLANEDDFAAQTHRVHHAPEAASTLEVLVLGD
ncbi:MAG: CocE/NonD family hydrolase [Planctomycetota bacterium]